VQPALLHNSVCCYAAWSIMLAVLEA